MTWGEFRERFGQQAYEDAGDVRVVRRLLLGRLRG
jgi:hypothetical protein